MSALTPTLAPMTVDPWDLLRSLAHITLAWHDGGPMGRATHSTQTISLRRGMTWEERRCTVQHELNHLEVGPVPLGLRAKDEELVRRRTALQMIPDIRPVGEAIAWALCEEEAAEELGVDVCVLRYRLRHMSPMERAWLTHRLGVGEEV